MRSAVLSFPAGSTGQPDGLQPQHLRDLVLCREAGSDFLSTLTAFVNIILAGAGPADVASIFPGVLKNKPGGVRPIVVGFTLRRLVSKCAILLALKGYVHTLVRCNSVLASEAVVKLRSIQPAGIFAGLPQDHVLVN